MTESWEARNYYYLIPVNEEILENREVGFNMYITLRSQAHSGGETITLLRCIPGRKQSSCHGSCAANKVYSRGVQVRVGGPVFQRLMSANKRDTHGVSPSTCSGGPKLGWVRQADVANCGPSSTSPVGSRGMPYNSAATTFSLALSRLQSLDRSDTCSE
jgi:hypothetical protein